MVIGLSGKIRSGKSRVASIIKKTYEKNGLQCEVKSFAQPLYEIISRLYDTDIKTIKKDKQKNLPIYIHTRTTNSGMVTTNYREILQTIGNTARDYGDQDIWVDALFGNDYEKIMLDMANNNVECWVIDDLRFPNEAQRILDCKGKLIRINRSDAEENEHIVENSLNDWTEWDLGIENDHDKKKKRNRELKGLIEEFLSDKIPTKRGATNE